MRAADTTTRIPVHDLPPAPPPPAPGRITPSDRPDIGPVLHLGRRRAARLRRGCLCPQGTPLLPARSLRRRPRRPRPGRPIPADRGVAAALHYPTQAVLGNLFGTSYSTALQAVSRSLPLLEQGGKDHRAG